MIKSAAAKKLNPSPTMGAPADSSNGWKRGLCVEAPHRVLFGVCGSDQYHGSGQAAILCVAPLAGTAIVDSAMRETTIAGALRGPHASFHQSSPLSSPTIQAGTSTR